MLPGVAAAPVEEAKVEDVQIQQNPEASGDDTVESDIPDEEEFMFGG